jgi:hypothetical protein
VGKDQVASITPGNSLCFIADGGCNSNINKDDALVGVIGIDCGGWNINVI